MIQEVKGIFVDIIQHSQEDIHSRVHEGDVADVVQLLSKGKLPEEHSKLFTVGTYYQDHLADVILLDQCK